MQVIEAVASPGCSSGWGQPPQYFTVAILRLEAACPGKSGRSSNTLSIRGDMLATFRLLFPCRECYFNADQWRLINGFPDFGHNL